MKQDQVQPAWLSCLSWQGCRWADTQVRVRQSSSAAVKFGKSITEGRALALRVRSIEVPVARWRKPEQEWKCGGASCLELLLPSEGESQRPDHPEVESKSSQRVWLLYLSKCQSMKDHETPCLWGISGRARPGQVIRGRGAQRCSAKTDWV